MKDFIEAKILLNTAAEAAAAADDDWLLEVKSSLREQFDKHIFGENSASEEALMLNEGHRKQINRPTIASFKLAQNQKTTFMVRVLGTKVYCIG